MPHSKFIEMALSFAGGDGGNLRSEVWFCGFEWGNTSDQKIKETIEAEFQPMPEPASWAEKEFDGSWNANYNQKICWFLKYFYDLDWDRMSYEEYVRAFKILHPDGLGFKLNLLPVRFRNRSSVEWGEAVKEASGFDSFEEYRAWCVTHRGKFFRDLLKKYSPKVLICTGVGERNNFFLAFTDDSIREQVQLKDFSISVAWFEKTLVCVTPFFGGLYGINSYAKMEQVVGEIKELLAAGCNDQRQRP